MKAATKMILNLLLIGQIVAFTGCKKYIIPNNHDYSKVTERSKLLNDDPSLKLTSSDRYAIPSITQKFDKPNDDFTPPHYAKDEYFKDTNNRNKDHVSDNLAGNIKLNKGKHVTINNDKKRNLDQNVAKSKVKILVEDSNDDLGDNLEGDLEEGQVQDLSQGLVEDPDENLPQDLNKDLQKNLEHSKNLDLEEEID